MKVEELQGRELDAEIGIAFGGFQWVTSPSSDHALSFLSKAGYRRADPGTKRARDWDATLPAYSSDLSRAFEALRHSGFESAVITRPGEVKCHLWEQQGEGLWIVEGQPGEEAQTICRALLLAKEEKK